jgi:hypothetical protein
LCDLALERMSEDAVKVECGVRHGPGAPRAGTWARLGEALFLGRAVDEAQRGLPVTDGAQRRWALVARRAFAAAEDARAGEPEGLTRGVVPVELYRGALHAALLARSPRGESLPSASALWAGHADGFALVAPDPAELETTRLAFVREGSLVGSEQEEAFLLEGRLRVLAVAVLEELRAPRRRYLGLLARRWGGIAACAGLLLVLASSLAWSLVSKPNLLAGKSARTSSAGSAFDARHIRFQTAEEVHPYIEFDLGRPTRLSGLTVQNRTDCCWDRAIPLVAEVSDDGRTFREIARQARDFRRWEPSFDAVRARYLRLTVPRKTILHLKRIEAHP